MNSGQSQGKNIYCPQMTRNKIFLKEIQSQTKPNFLEILVCKTEDNSSSGPPSLFLFSFLNPTKFTQIQLFWFLKVELYLSPVLVKELFGIHRR